MTTEQEFKWSARNPGDFAKFKKAAALDAYKKTFFRRNIFDSYFDDINATLRAQKTALRLRSTDGKYEITVKSAAKIKNGLAERVEETLPLKNVKSQTRAKAALRTAFAKLWPGLKGPAQLFIIKNKREICLIESPHLTAEISFDNCNIITPKHNIKFYEVEMEFKKGSFPVFKQLAADITAQSGLEYSKKSKVATAAELLA